MFKNNLEALEIKNKALADRIAKIKPDALKDISAARAENGEYILIYKQVPLHDTKDPMREAKSIWFRNIKLRSRVFIQTSLCQRKVKSLSF